VIKATGQGLSRALDSFSVSPEPPRVTMRDGSGSWSAMHWRRESFHFAVAAQGAVKADFRQADAASLF
jgi:4'-phosphopantetheinyl transferase